jgi:hypothetical protein
MNELLNSCKVHNKKNRTCCIKIQKQECMKYEALGAMNSLNQSFEIELQRNAK